MAVNTLYIVGYDDDYASALTGSDGLPLPESQTTYEQSPFMKDGAPVSYAAYLDYYGDPNRHVVLFVQRRDQCVHCGTWIDGDAQYGIDVMDDQPEARAIGVYTSLEELPEYLKDVARDLEMS